MHVDYGYMHQSIEEVGPGRPEPGVFRQIVNFQLHPLCWLLQYTM